MKKLLLSAIIALSSLAVNAQGTWVSQATGFPTTSSGVRNIAPVDSNVLWISDYDGSGGAANFQDFSHTNNGGATWTAGVVPCGSNYGWSMITAADSNTAWAMFYDAVAGSGGGIWKTSDGGATWNQQGVGTIFNSTSFPDVVHFWDVDTGFALGDPNSAEFEIYTTTDGGTTWNAVPGANIPNPLSGEYGIVGHYNVIGNDVWFDTNKGRVYHSTDKGLTWTVGSTGITVPANGAIDVVFYSTTNGVARLYNTTTGANTMKVTADGGATWTAATPTGNFFGSDVKYIPGTTSRLISTGAATGFIGSSFSNDGGLTWTDIETSAQRTALGVVDSNHIWCGGFTTSPTTDGIFKYQLIPNILCGDPGTTAGFATASVAHVCPGDTVTLTSIGVYGPTAGTYAGVSWVITSADISGSSDPLNDPSLIASYNFNFPDPSTSIRSFVNDGTLINGSTVPYGTYYWTPVVFGNANPSGTTATFLSDLVLDPSCTACGNSVAVNVLSSTDSLCSTVGINELKNNLGAYCVVKGNLVDVTVNTTKGGLGAVELFDLSGRSVLAQSSMLSNGVSHVMIPVEHLTSGTYIVKVQLNGSSVQSKFFKQ